MKVLEPMYLGNALQKIFTIVIGVVDNYQLKKKNTSVQFLPLKTT